MTLLTNLIHYMLGHVWTYKINKNNKATARRCQCGVSHYRVNGQWKGE